MEKALKTQSNDEEALKMMSERPSNPKQTITLSHTPISEVLSIATASQTLADEQSTTTTALTSGTKTHDKVNEEFSHSKKTETNLSPPPHSQQNMPISLQANQALDSSQSKIFSSRNFQSLTSLQNKPLAATPSPEKKLLVSPSSVNAKSADKALSTKTEEPKDRVDDTFSVALWAFHVFFGCLILILSIAVFSAYSTKYWHGMWCGPVYITTGIISLIEWRKKRKPFLVAFGVTSVVCLIVALVQLILSKQANMDGEISTLEITIFIVTLLELSTAVSGTFASFCLLLQPKGAVQKSNHPLPTVHIKRIQRVQYWSKFNCPQLLPSSPSVYYSPFERTVPRSRRTRSAATTSERQTSRQGVSSKISHKSGEMSYQLFKSAQTPTSRLLVPTLEPPEKKTASAKELKSTLTGGKSVSHTSSRLQPPRVSPSRDDSKTSTLPVSEIVAPISQATSSKTTSGADTTLSEATTVPNPEDVPSLSPRHVTITIPANEPSEQQVSQHLQDF